VRLLIHFDGRRQKMTLISIELFAAPSRQLRRSSLQTNVSPRDGYTRYYLTPLKYTVAKGEELGKPRD
jgi:hypothetical protein